MNLTTCNLAQKLVCLGEIRRGKFDIVCALAESPKDKIFLQSLMKK